LRETPGNTGFNIPIHENLDDQTFSGRRNIEVESGENIMTGFFHMPSDTEPNGGIPFGGEYEYIYFQFEILGSRRRRTVSTVVSLDDFRGHRRTIETTNITDPLAIYEAMILEALEEVEEEIEEELRSQFTVVYIVVGATIGTLVLCICGIGAWVFYVQKKQEELKKDRENENYSEMQEV